MEKARHPLKEVGEREEADRKRHARLSFWLERLRPVSGDAALFCHPQLNEAADMVLNIAERGEKVLVFGAYTRPMRAFTLLLNAHAMLTTLSCRERGEKKFWPQPSWPGEGLPALALVAALKSERQRFWKGSRAEDIRQRLASQYREYRRDLIHLRSRIHGLLQEKLPLPCGFGQFIDLFTRWLEEELGFEKAEALDGEGILLKCRELGARITGRESPDEVNIDSRTADLIRNGLTDESDFGSPRSAFARMMDGRTPRTVRYALQDAFNRPASRLRVLVTQSMVGREGLNLHRACRHIFRLHPQWNPGYAEQEIGRIDRIASLWSRKVLGSEGEKQDISAQLGVSCIVFEGTYEAFRWHVLTERSAMLHGQLYGDPLPDILPETEEEKEWIREIVRAAPSFSPLKEEREERIPDEHR